MSESNPKPDTKLMRSIRTEDEVRAYAARRFPHLDAKAMAADWFKRLEIDARKTTQIVFLMMPEVARVIASS